MADNNNVISALIFEPQPWHKDAVCDQLPTDLFFPSGKSEGARTDEERAKEVCSLCPVQAECLEFALVHEERYGIWGGTTPDERRHLKRP
jgi:WhiB family redox-sensing transcriptional regulator